MNSKVRGKAGYLDPVLEFLNLELMCPCGFHDTVDVVNHQHDINVQTYHGFDLCVHGKSPDHKAK